MKKKKKLFITCGAFLIATPLMMSLIVSCGKNKNVKDKEDIEKDSYKEDEDMFRNLSNISFTKGRINKYLNTVSIVIEGENLDLITNVDRQIKVCNIKLPDVSIKGWKKDKESTKERLIITLETNKTNDFINGNYEISLLQDPNIKTFAKLRGTGIPKFSKSKEAKTKWFNDQIEIEIRGENLDYLIEENDFVIKEEGTNKIIKGWDVISFDKELYLVFDNKEHLIKENKSYKITLKEFPNQTKIIKNMKKVTFESGTISKTNEDVKISLKGSNLDLINVFMDILIINLETMEDIQNIHNEKEISKTKTDLKFSFVDYSKEISTGKKYAISPQFDSRKILVKLNWK